MTLPTPSPIHRPLWALFFCTGLSGLLLEQGFERWLSTVVGASRQSGAIVLALYFVGLALGAKLFAPLARRVTDGIRLYALLEGAVGVYALGLGYFPDLIMAQSTKLVALVPPDSAGSAAVRILIGALWILPPTLAMGATFPAVVRALEQRSDRSLISSRMSSLYAANLLGAVTAALLAPYLFFAYVGVDGTIQLVVAVQTVIVVSAYTLSKRPIAPTSSPDDGPQGDADPQKPPPSPSEPSARPVVGLAFFSGLCVFAFEVLWIHLIGAAIGMSAFSFALMLVCVLLGLGLASALVSRFRATSPSLDNGVLGVAFLLAGVATTISLQLWDAAGDILLLFGGGAQSFFAGEVARFATAAVVLLPCSITLGTIYPLLFRVDLFPRERAALVSSQMTMANAIGSMLGALGTGFLLLNTLGAEWTMRLLCALLAAVSLAMLVWAQRGQDAPRRETKGMMGLAVLLLFVPLLTPSWDYLRLASGVNVYFQTGHAEPGDEVVFLGEDNVSGFTTITKKRRPDRPQGMLTLLTNGKFQGNDAGEVTAQVSFAYLPSAYATGRERALVIGLGTGASAATIDAAGFARTDIAELSPTILEAAKLFKHINRDLFARPSVRVYIEDGRTHLARTPAATYDVMSLELSSVWFAGTTNLYSRDFYELARSRLKPGGVFQQWVQLHHIGSGELLSIISTLRKVFEHVHLHFVGGQGILIASAQPLSVDPDHARRTAETVQQGFANIPEAALALRPGMLDATLVLDEQDTTRLLEYVERSGLIINDDRNRYLEFWSPRYNLEPINHVRVNLAFLFEFVDPDEKMARAPRFGFRVNPASPPPTPPPAP